MRLMVVTYLNLPCVITKTKSFFEVRFWPGVGFNLLSFGLFLSSQHYLLKCI